MLYIDSSTLLTLLLQQEGCTMVESVIAEAEAAGTPVVSSRLLWLETRRISIREALVGNDIDAPLREHLAAVTQLPITGVVLERAETIEQHIKTLDAIHLATCELVEATLLTARLDSGLRRVAAARGIPLATSPGSPEPSKSCPPAA